MKYFILILSFILSIIFPPSTFSSDELISKLQSGGNIVFIRHALAPGNGDPDNIDLNNCKTQRNLNKTGIDQSKRIGLFFKNNNILSDNIKFRFRDKKQFIISSLSEHLEIKNSTFKYRKNRQLTYFRSYKNKYFTIIKLWLFSVNKKKLFMTFQSLEMADKKSFNYITNWIDNRIS